MAAAGWRQKGDNVSAWMKRSNDWVFEHPWPAAAGTFALPVVTGTTFRLLVMQDQFGPSIAGAGTYALVMSLIFGIVWDRRGRRDRGG
jgi:hypothetical protein